jgi:predicted kinase
LNTELSTGNVDLKKPVLIVVNGLPGAGKTMLAKRLGQNVGLPVFSRDGLYETLFVVLGGESAALPPSVGSASFSLLYYVATTVLAAGQSLIVEGFFGRPELRTAEFIQLQSRADFVPFQILCKADGDVLIERFLARAGSAWRHAGHTDSEWLEQNKERLLSGQLEPLALGGQLVEIDTTTPEHFDYDALLLRVRAALA